MAASSEDLPLHNNGRAPKGFIVGLLDAFSSIWFGVALLIILFFYCSVGSAVQAVRTHPLLEMTEFEWFHWWPFDVLVVLMCISLTLATIRRIPLCWPTAGVWMIHGGIIVLCLGSYLYFGTKVEGDAPVFRRRVTIQVPGSSEPVHLVCLPGARKSVDAGPDRWQFAIQSTNTDWPILSDEHKGERTYAVNVSVTKPDGGTFIRQLLDGYPQYTEDVIPGKGRAIKNLGRKLVAENLKIELDYEPQTYFHVMDSWALYVRRPGETTWRARSIPGLPRYNDFVSSREAVFVDHPIHTRVIDIEVPPGDSPDAFGDTPVRVTSYLRYASMERRWHEGDGPLNPVLRVTMPGSDGAPIRTDLVAFDARRNHSPGGIIQFVWFDNAQAFEQLPTSSWASLGVAFPGSDVSLTIPINEKTVAGGSGAFTPVEDTGFSYRIRNVADNLAVGSGSVSVAMVDVQTPDGTVFTRMVADRPEMTKDLHGDATNPHAPIQKQAKPVDERIVMTYKPASAPIILAATGDGELSLAFNSDKGRELTRKVTIGEPVAIVPGFEVRVDAYLAHGVSEVKPYVVPPERRDREVGTNMAMIRLEVGTGPSRRSTWLPFNTYVFDDDQYAGSHRFSYEPRSVRLPDGDVVEVMFSRERRRLPNPIALDDFELLTHLGGYTGNSLTVRNYVSRLKFFADNKWTTATPIRVNQPTEYGGLWYFQSTWDPPARGVPGSGMNYTGIGVGNRNGVYVQLAGCCIAVAGMIFAFYVKPIIVRRRRDRARATISGDTREDAEEGDADPCEARPVMETAV